MDVKRKIQDYVRVLRITKKPDRTEYWSATKITGIGLIVIGTVGLIIFLIFNVIGIV